MHVFEGGGLDLPVIFFLSVGLAMDAFAVSVASGIAITRLRVRHAVRIALFFGFFQALMPVAGWLLGLGFRSAIEAFDHWLAFGLLGAIGGKMLYESFRLEEAENPRDPMSISVLLVLSVATSIDALAVGLTLSVIKVPVVGPALIIGVVTFALSYAGIYIGDRFGHFFEKKAEALGGLILIGIGLKILLEHLVG
ncbi:MAG: manganese efflux pump MntP family protein [Nitrospirota bacterium]|jgi:putative Mn2+ efflux pump MntP